VCHVTCGADVATPRPKSIACSGLRTAAETEDEALAAAGAGERADRDLGPGIADFDICVVREHLPCCVLAYHQPSRCGHYQCPLSPCGVGG
jgi:hypothetical protein